MNPFELKAQTVERTLMDWKQIYPKPYDKAEVDPYTRTRVILMNGTEFENVWFGHQFARHCVDNELRRQLALIRRSEQQQQKLISALKPIDETVLEHTIGYEQLAVDLTAALAQRSSDQNVKNALDFALLEDFDHLYRYSNLLEMEAGVFAEQLVGQYTEIMPGRPTISEHRHPFDSIRNFIDDKQSPIETRLAVNIITAAEQQTMNYYMNVCGAYTSELGRKLYQEIGMIEEQHVSQYESLIDTRPTWLECLLMHQYTECFLYYSCMSQETDRNIKQIWEELFEQELAHLQLAVQLLKQYENKDWSQVIPDAEFPEPLLLQSNIDYVRGVLISSVQLTATRETYRDVSELSRDADFFRYQQLVNRDERHVPSHMVIDRYIRDRGQDYRWTTQPDPIPELQNRTKDNTSVGRTELKQPVMA